ncbi:DedA family protein [Streptomyces deccanensis]|uniref:DedA family protein n=1 Tax=Streptomyces deccanensis TaxID=424188 RepID=UPI001EFB7150|nr:VTT domain-containing protein [Streptomyces deccanensis]ULR47982.1 VTT domain-containing protein [Streptomyces deccanensis]
MNAVSDILGHVSPTSAYTVVAGAVLAESVLLVGAFIPTLTLLLTAGALARTGQLSLPVVIAVAAGAVVAGDFFAHRTGRLLGEQLRSGRVGSRVPDTTWRRAEMLMTRRGGRSILLARFLPVVRTLAPHFAGATRLPYRSIAPYSVVAACLWATAEVGVGYAAAASLQRVLTLGGPALATVVLIALGTTLLRRRSPHPTRRADASPRSGPECPDGAAPR